MKIHIKHRSTLCQTYCGINLLRRPTTGGKKTATCKKCLRLFNMSKKIIISIISVFLFTIPAKASQHFEARNSIAEKAEILLPKVCQILGYQVSDSLKIKIIESDVNGCSSFENTIYIKNDANDTILAHEMAHAILARETSYSLSEKSQEILAKYTEYVLTKKDTVPIIKQKPEIKSITIETTKVEYISSELASIALAILLVLLIAVLIIDFKKSKNNT